LLPKTPKPLKLKYIILVLLLNWSRQFAIIF